MPYRFKQADNVDSERLHVSTAAGTFLLGTPVEEDTLEPTDEILVADEDGWTANVLRELTVDSKNTALELVEAPEPPAPEDTLTVDLTGTVPQSVADRHPDAVRNTDPDRIVPDELGQPPAADESSPDTVTEPEPGTPGQPEGDPTAVREANTAELREHGLSPKGRVSGPGQPDSGTTPSGEGQ